MLVPLLDLLQRAELLIQCARSAPAGAIATGVIAFVMPTHFPTHGHPAVQITLRNKFSRSSLSRLDVAGAVILLASSVLVVFGFEQAGSRYPWASPAILSTLIIGGLLFVGFVLWEYVIGRRGSAQEPIFPLRLMKDRIFAGLMLSVNI
jgi:hypothetical protein